MASILTIGNSDIFLKASAVFIPNAGNVGEGSDYSVSLAGEGTVSAVTVSKSGLPVALCGNIGNDVFGSMFSKLASSYKITDSYITKDTQKRTGLLLNVLEDGVYPKNVYFPGANNSLSSEHVDNAAGYAPDIALISSKIPHIAFKEAVEEMNRQEATVIIDATDPRGNISLDYVEECDVLIMTEDSIRDYSSESFSGDTNKMRVANSIAEKINYKNIIIVQNNGIAFSYDGLHYDFTKKYEFQKIDSYYKYAVLSGAFTSAYITSESVKEASDYAMAAAALFSSKPGIIKAVPSVSEVNDYRTNIIE